MDLIERLEAAEEGSRELDGRIHFREYNYDLVKGEFRVGYDPTWKGDMSIHSSSLLIPPYTTSLDAALTLVPEGWTWHVGWMRVHRENPGSAQLLNAKAEPSEYRVNATTPALALCIAALKARGQK